MGKVQIDESMLAGFWVLLDNLKDYELDNVTAIVRDALQQQVNEKYAAIERRKIFSEYKTAEKGSADRESKRQEYLNSVGIHKDWRTQQEHSY
jgi:endonuclease III